MNLPQATFTPASVPLEAAKAPDQVLVIGATGHMGRVFLEQGLELFDGTEFRVLLRNPDKAKDMPPGVVSCNGDVCDLESIRAACDGFTEDSLIFDSVTQIDLSPTDEDGSITAINLQGVLNVIQVAKELGLTLHRAHSNGGVPCPKEGVITERTQEGDSEEEVICASLPYLKAKKDATKALLDAQAEGVRVMFTYLPSPMGLASRADAIFNGLVESFVKTGRFFHPEGIDMAYVDARDAAKVHWVAFMRAVYDDFILSNNATREDIMGSFEQTTGDLPEKLAAQAKDDRQDRQAHGLLEEVAFQEHGVSALRGDRAPDVRQRELLIRQWPERSSASPRAPSATRTTIISKTSSTARSSTSLRRRDPCRFGESQGNPLD